MFSKHLFSVGFFGVRATIGASRISRVGWPMQCPKCMVDYTRPLNFCPADGTPLDADALRLAVRGHVVQPSRRIVDAISCGGCGTMLALHVRFCPDCGTAIAPRVAPATVGGRLFHSAEWLATAFAWVFKVFMLALGTQNHLSIFQWAGGFVLVMAVAWLPLWVLRGARAWWLWVTAPARK